MPQTVSRYARENFRLKARVDEFEMYFSDERMRINGIDPRLLEPSGLDRMLGDVEHLLDETGSIMLTAYANLLSAVLVLNGLLRTFAGSQGSGFYRELLSGLQDVDSARPGFVLWQIAQLARDEPELADCIRTADLKELTVAGLPGGRTRDALTRFLQDYGFRGIREAEIAAPRWSEDPTLMFATLRSHLAGTIDLVQRGRDLQFVREEAEERLKKSVPFVLRPAVAKLLDLVRRYAECGSTCVVT